MTEAGHSGKTQSAYSIESPPDSPTMEALRALPVKNISLLIFIPVYSLFCANTFWRPDSSSALPIPGTGWLVCFVITYATFIYMLYRTRDIVLATDWNNERYSLLNVNTFTFVALFCIPGVNLVWSILMLSTLVNGLFRFHKEIAPPGKKWKCQSQYTVFLAAMAFLLAAVIVAAIYVGANNTPTGPISNQIANGLIVLSFTEPGETSSSETNKPFWPVWTILAAWGMTLFIAIYPNSDLGGFGYMVYTLMGELLLLPCVLLFLEAQHRVDAAYIGITVIIWTFVFLIISLVRLNNQIASLMFPPRFGWIYARENKGNEPRLIE